MPLYLQSLIVYSTYQFHKIYILIISICSFHLILSAYKSAPQAHLTSLCVGYKKPTKVFFLGNLKRICAAQKESLDEHKAHVR